MSPADVTHRTSRVGSADSTSPAREHRPTVVAIAGRSLTLSPVFDTYWRFAAERQAIYEVRLAGRPPKVAASAVDRFAASPAR
jgi:hypothetical protein